MIEYRVLFKDMNYPDNEWTSIDPENIELMIADDIMDNFDIPEDSSLLDQATIMAKAIHMIDGYEGYHTQVVESDTGNAIHYFILESVDLIDENWLSHLVNSFGIDNETFENAIKQESLKMTNKGFKDIFAHLNKRKS